MTTRKRIVAVDRDPEWLRFVTEVLTRAGYDVLVASERHIVGDDSALRSTELMLVDASFQRSIDKLTAQHQRFVVFDSVTSVPDAIEAYRSGAMDYSSKAFEPSVLLRVVDEALQKGAVRKAVTRVGGLTT